MVDVTGRKTGGRPAGVPNKATRELKALAQVHGPALIKELARLALKAQSEQARVGAIKEMFDRGWGKASQAVQLSGTLGTYDLTKLSDDKLRELAAILGPIADVGSDSGGAIAPTFVPSFKPDPTT
jgi:hypothetical protein